MGASEVRVQILPQQVASASPWLSDIILSFTGFAVGKLLDSGRTEVWSVLLVSEPTVAGT